MDEISNKALLIGVGLFVTIIITSGVLYTLGEMKEIYSQVYETNISLQDMFSEFDEYDNTLKTGIDILNTAKKYKDNNLVQIFINNQSIDKNNYINTYDTQEEFEVIGKEVYDSTVSIDQNTGEVRIIFKIQEK